MIDTPRTDSVVSGLKNMLARFANSNSLPEKFSQVQATLVIHSEILERELATAVRDADRYAYVKEHFDEIYQLPIWTNDGNPDYRIDSDKFDAVIDAAMKECEK